MTQSKPITTYSETQGEAPFDWWAALENPPAVGSAEHQRLVPLTASWVTCACGNQCMILPRCDEGEPVDEISSMYGNDFYDQITYGRWDVAREVLGLIEARSAELIAEMVEA